MSSTFCREKMNVTGKALGRIQLTTLPLFDQKVDQIIMPTLGLKGVLPTELASLEHVKRLVFDANQLEGLIPYVPSLTSLSLAYNYLGDTLPSYVGQMTNLEELILAENLLEGRIPDSMRNVTHLKRFSVNGNECTGGIHSLSLT